MGNLNLYYRAFKAYRSHTETDKTCAKSRRNIVKAASEEDRLEATRNYCIIEEDWVKKIEWGLPFVEKAIEEERQFIKNEGEVLNIEKIKRVSKESVVHLARHSEYITREPKDGSDIVPDKIYMEKRDSDFLVYENRFLYMLLCYMRDFIGLRLKKIREAGSAYNGKLFYKRDFQINGGRLFFEGKFEENALKNPFDFAQGDYELIERIESAHHLVASLLNKPLMTIVSKSPILKPPITKTNVLKMDLKFKNAVELYEYLASYKGDGFKIETRKKVYTDFTGALADELSEIINLTSFLTYEYGAELLKTLETEYEKELEEKRAQELAESERRTEQLKKRFADGSVSPEEYILSLEDTLKAYRNENARLLSLKSSYEILSEKYQALKQELAELNERNLAISAALAAKETEYAALEEKYRVDLAQAEERRLNELKKANEEFEKARAELTAAYDAKLADAENRRLSEIDELNKISEQKLAEIKSEFDALSREHDLLIAQYTAYKRLHGEADEKDYTPKEEFEKLEKQFSAYYDFFTEQWKLAKKSVRKEYLWQKAKVLRDKI